VLYRGEWVEENWKFGWEKGAQGGGLKGHTEPRGTKRGKSCSKIRFEAYKKQTKVLKAKSLLYISQKVLMVLKKGWWVRGEKGS